MVSSRIVGTLGRSYVLRHPRSPCTWSIWIDWSEIWKSSNSVFQILVVLLKQDFWKVGELHFPEIKWVTLGLLLGQVVRATKTCGRTEKRKSCLNTRANQEIGNKLSFISLFLCVWSQMNGGSRIYFLACLWTRSSFRIRSIDYEVQTGVPTAKMGSALCICWDWL